MKYYKLIYDYSTLISNFLIENKDEFMDNLTDEEKLKESEDINPMRYAWYEEGEIYSEDENCDGEAIKVSELLKKFPEDWKEVSIDEYNNQKIL